MNTGPDMPAPPGRDPDAALTPEERAMAEHIARANPQREPPASLDASILAAARDAVAAPTAPAAPLPRERPRVRRRWPVAVGVAATLVLAVGIAWQLRPVDDIHVEYSEAPRAAVAIPTPGPGGPQAGDESQADDSVAARVITPPAPEMVPAQASDSESTPVVEEPKKPVPQVIAEPQEAPAEPAIVFDEPSPMDTPGAPPSPMPVPPPPPAPPAASMAQSAQTPASVAAPVADAATSATAMESKARAQRSPARDDAATAGAAKAATATGNLTVESGRARTGNEADAADARSLDRIEVTGSRIERFGDQPLDDEPPASADSPQVQQAWLQRVRQLVAEHRIDAARDSLREYQRRYPDAPMPDDLRALLVE